MENQSVQPVNPLKKYYRQPKFYIKLPSSGQFYAPNSLELSDNGEYPIYAMTAKDEIAMKTPDALLNGQSIVDTIQSCVPNIKNAWAVPSIDIDALLVAIRMATYGETLDIDTKIPGTDIEKTYVADLRRVLDRLINATFESVVQISNEMVAHIRPLTYLEFTRTTIKTLEEQRIFAVVNDDNLDEDAKISLFNQSFKKITDITVGMVAQSVVKIVTPEGEVSDAGFIKEFIENADKNFYSRIITHLEQQRDRFKIEPFRAATTEEEQAAGAPKEFEFPIELDASNFFG